MLWTSFHSECSVGSRNGVWFPKVTHSSLFSGCTAEILVSSLRLPGEKEPALSRAGDLDPEKAAYFISEELHLLQVWKRWSGNARNIQCGGSHFRFLIVFLSGSSSPAFQVHFHSVGPKMERGAVNDWKGISDADVFCLGAIWVLTRSSWNYVHGAEGSNTCTGLEVRGKGIWQQEK